jgi:uncharacterized protein YjbJ (UPF0337 family)
MDGDRLVLGTRKTQVAALLFAAVMGFAGAARAIDSDTVRGDGKQVTGTVKEKGGQLFGDQKLEDKGRAERENGKVESAWGRFKDSVRDIATSIENKLSGK